jgi:hypothetical protein
VEAGTSSGDDVDGS